MAAAAAVHALKGTKAGAGPAKPGIFDRVKAFAQSAVQEATRRGNSAMPTKLSGEENLHYVVGLVGAARGAQVLQQLYLNLGFVVSPPDFLPAPRPISALLADKGASIAAATGASALSDAGVALGWTASLPHLRMYPELAITDATADSALAVHCLAQELRHELEAITRFLEEVVLAFMLDDVSRNVGNYLLVQSRQLLDES